jgi:hypothetical protein
VCIFGTFVSTFAFWQLPEPPSFHPVILRYNLVLVLCATDGGPRNTGVSRLRLDLRNRHRTFDEEITQKLFGLVFRRLLAAGGTRRGQSLVGSNCELSPCKVKAPAGTDQGEADITISGPGSSELFATSALLLMPIPIDLAMICLPIGVADARGLSKNLIGIYDTSTCGAGE